MAKRRSKGRIAESTATFKLRKRQQKLRYRRAEARTRILPKKTKPMTLMEKTDQIGVLTIKHQNDKAAKNFLDFIVIRRQPGIKRIKEMPIPHEKKAEALTIGLVQGGIPITEKVYEINQWLKSIGRTDLKLTMGDVIEMILS